MVSRRTFSDAHSRAVDRAEALQRLEDEAARPLLDRAAWPDPVILESVEVLRAPGDKDVVHVRSRDGAEGWAVSNEMHFRFLFPLLQERILPCVLGRDLRDWENLLGEIFRHRSNYKMQGLPFWLPLASLEFAVLDLLGRRAGRPVFALFGEPHRTDIGLYYAHNDRDRTAAESVDRLVETVQQTGATAVKFKVGGRMSRNRDALPGRTETLIPLARSRLGPDVTLYADSNGSYDVREAIRIGRLLEENDVAFFEEPVPFDRFADTKAVADALDIPLAGGEQDASAYNLAWALSEGALQVVQPDLFYFGGLIRSLRLARVAQALGRDCTPHLSGSGLGFLPVLHFAAAVPNCGPHQEFKGIGNNIPFVCPTASLQPENGRIRVPTGPGWGVDLDPDWLRRAERLPSA